MMAFHFISCFHCTRPSLILDQQDQIFKILSAKMLIFIWPTSNNVFYLSSGLDLSWDVWTKIWRRQTPWEKIWAKCDLIAMVLSNLFRKNGMELSILQKAGGAAGNLHCFVFVLLGNQADICRIWNERSGLYFTAVCLYYRNIET